MKRPNPCTWAVTRRCRRSVSIPRHVLDQTNPPPIGQNEDLQGQRVQRLQSVLRDFQVLALAESGLSVRKVAVSEQLSFQA